MRSAAALTLVAILANANAGAQTSPPVTTAASPTPAAIPPSPASARPAAPTSVPPRDAQPSAPTSGLAVDWLISETRSPVDYRPIAVAVASTTPAEGPPMRFSIQCRGGRTEMVMSSADAPLAGQDKTVALVVNGGPPTALAVRPPASGEGLALGGDVVGLLTSLPGDGEVAFVVTRRQGDTVRGGIALGPLKGVVSRLAGPCGWPAAGSGSVRKP